SATRTSPAACARAPTARSRSRLTTPTGCASCSAKKVARSIPPLSPRPPAPLGAGGAPTPPAPRSASNRCVAAQPTLLLRFAPTPMDQIGKYAIVGQIGTGGFGVVYEGRDPFLKRRVAIKTCSSEEPEIRDRFFREAEIAGNLQHRNIVTVHDFGIQDGVPYLVQEYLTGEDLDRVVARREPLPAAKRVDILVQAARGLEYAHRQGVIHRDVKPAN